MTKNTALLLNGLIRDRSTEILTKSKIKAVASRLNFSKSKTNLVLLTCSEIMSNQVKYSVGAGVIQIWEHKEPFHSLDIFGYDMGPGIKNIGEALKDGYSTSNTLGHGLGTILRCSDLCQIYTKPDRLDRLDTWNGTAVWCRFYNKNIKSDSFKKHFQTGTFIRAYNDDVYNGDYINTAESSKKLTWLHIDGLGHGKSAHEAVEIASRIPIKNMEPPDIIKNLNSNLLGKRKANGVAISLENNGVFLHSGYGNVSVKKIDSNDKIKTVDIPNRTIGENRMDVYANKAEIKPGELLFTCSDGISNHWNNLHFPGLFTRHPQLAAYLLGNIFSRRNDDKSLFIIKLNKE